MVNVVGVCGGKAFAASFLENKSGRSKSWYWRSSGAGSSVLAVFVCWCYASEYIFKYEKVGYHWYPVPVILVQAVKRGMYQLSITSGGANVTIKLTVITNNTNNTYCM